MRHLDYALWLHCCVSPGQPLRYVWHDTTPAAGGGPTRFARGLPAGSHDRHEAELRSVQVVAREQAIEFCERFLDEVRAR